MLEVESDSTTVVSCIHSQGLVSSDYAYSLCQIYVLSFSYTILFRYVLQEATSATNFLAN